jgi:hypothetical protein
VKAYRSACSFLLALEIGDDQAPAWPEHPDDFRETLPFETRRQMMHHQGREHHIEYLIGKGELLDHPDLKLDWYLLPSRFRAGTGDLLFSRVNTNHMARAAHAALGFQRQRPSTATHIQHLLPGVKVGESGSPLSELTPLATEQAGVDEPSIVCGSGD